MQFVLVLNFNYRIYKRQPIAKIFVGSSFIDEFDIGNDDANHQNNQSIADDLNLNTHPNCYKEYLIDLPREDTRVSIQISNDDNNYTNGFMSKFTHVNLNYCNLFPRKLFSKKNLLKENWPISSISKNEKMYSKIKSREKRKKMQNIFSNMAPYCDFYSKNNTVIRNASHYTIGESGYYKLTLYCKHGIFWTSKIKGYCKCNYNEAFEFFANKYY